VWIFAKLFGTISLVYPCQRTCCINLKANEVVDFCHMVIKVHISYKCEHGIKCSIINRLVYGYNVASNEMVDKMCNIYCLNLGRVLKSEAIK
jgi:hypothetical protein